MREERGRVGEVGLGHDEQGADAGIQRRDEVAVDEPLARLGVGGGDDDEHLVGVGDDDRARPGRCRRRCGAAARCAPRCRRCGRACRSSPVRSPTTRARSPGDDRHLAQLARAHREDRVLVGRVLVDEHGVAAAVDAEHAADLASACAGRRFVRGRLAFGFGRTRTSASSNSGSSSSSRSSSQLTMPAWPPAAGRRVVRRPRACRCQSSGNCGHRLGGRADVVDLDARHGEADEGAGRREAVVVVRAPAAAVQRARHDADAVGELVRLAAERRAARRRAPRCGRSRGRGCARCRRGSSGRRRTRRARRSWG